MFYQAMTVAAFMIFSRGFDARVSRMLRQMNYIVMYPVLPGFEINQPFQAYFPCCCFLQKRLRVSR